MRLHLVYLAYIFLFCTNLGFAEPTNVDKVLSPQEIDDVTSSLKTQLDSQYVDIEIAIKTSLTLTKKLTQKKYVGITNPITFTKTINKDLFSASHDKHLQIIFAPKGIEIWLKDQHETSGNPDRPQLIDATSKNNSDNYGFNELKILDGNVGYLNLTAFYSPEVAQETAIQAMRFLSNANTVIIDLRNNSGGSPEMVQLLSSYFFDEKPVHLNTFYIRPSNDYIQTWTLPVIQGKHKPDVDLYILTSRRTFSAAEEFSYNLRNLKRAILIGETTAGGAHAGDFQQLTDRFFVYMPFAKAINPITNTNWEGIGVEPDIKVNAEDALLIAHKKAKENLAKNQSN